MSTYHNLCSPDSQLNEILNIPAMGCLESRSSCMRMIPFPCNIYLCLAVYLPMRSISYFCPSPMLFCSRLCLGVVHLQLISPPPPPVPSPHYSLEYRRQFQIFPHNPRKPPEFLSHRPRLERGVPASKLSFGYSRLTDIPQKDLEQGLVSYCDYQARLNTQPSPKSK